MSAFGQKQPSDGTPQSREAAQAKLPPLPPGFLLTGRDKESCILSFSNGDGVGLTANNRIESLTVMTTPAARATANSPGAVYSNGMLPYGTAGWPMPKWSRTGRAESGL